MKLEVGMHVRTIKGKIWIINSQQAISGHRKDIINASHNIIDLIEVGDYVNGCRVEEHAHEKGRLFVTYTYIGGKGFTTYEDYSWELTKDREEDIKSIVTKEQFEAIKYEVK